MGEAVPDQATSSVGFSYGSHCLLPEFQQLVHLDSQVLLHHHLAQRSALDAPLHLHVLTAQVKDGTFCWVERQPPPAKPGPGLEFLMAERGPRSDVHLCVISEQLAGALNAARKIIDKRDEEYRSQNRSLGDGAADRGPV